MEDYTRGRQRYDRIIDVAGNRSIFQCRRALKPRGVYVLLGGSTSRICACVFLGPLISIHYAHLTMLADRGIVSAADARALRAALDTISLADVRNTPYDGSCEDLFFHVERLLVTN